jgi:outer membrane receptor for ferrienterochelin and colicin
MRLPFLTLTLLFTFTLLAQKGTITGTLIDKDMNNEPLPFANAIIKGTTIGTTTDENGKYTLSVDPGNYTIQFSFLGYETVEVPVSVKANQIVTVNSPMSAGGGVQLADVVIVTTRRKNTDAAIMAEMKEAKQVVSAISAEQMSRGTDSNAAQAIQRVPGVTINQGKFVMIRGLSERYNNVMINNALAPSTEVDRRTFSFDLIPSNALDKMVIHKTGAAYLPGDFAGGVIKLTTSENFSEFTQVGVSFGYRTNTTFGDYFQSEGSGTDFLGFDNGFRSLPSGFPKNPSDLFDNNQSVAAARLLSNNFNPEMRSAFLDTGISFSMGRIIKFESGKTLSTVNSFSYSNKYENFNERNLTYNNNFTGGSVGPIQVLEDYNDAFYSNEVRISVLSNWMFRWNDKNKISFKNLLNQMGENSTILRTGVNNDQRQGDLLRNYELGYNSRFIYTGQFDGEHKLRENQKLDWVVGGNFLRDNLPDLRRFRTFRREDEPNAPFQMIDPPSANPFDTGRFFSELDEFSVSGGANYTYEIERIKNDEDYGSIILKAGVLGDFKTRDFSARYMSYIIPGSVGQDRKNELLILPLDEIFNEQNVNATDGWVLREGTSKRDSYSANNILTAGYLYAEIPLKKLDLSGGVRIEHNILQLDGFEGETPISVDQPITSVLPSLNLGYNLNERTVIRAAYSRTVNRPEFREIAPFLFYDFKQNSEVVGNPNLTTATIDNFDLRYEFYPTKGETASLGVFYKNLDKPIENFLPIAGSQRRVSFQNAESAYIYGAEIELRKSFESVFKVGFLSKLSANLNASYIISEVDLGASVEGVQDRNRWLQGQSPYVINFALGYSNKENGWDGNLIFNRFGDRIFAVGNTNFPTIYELARNQIDFTVSKSIKNTTYKLGVSNLLNDKFRFFQDTNVDNKINSSDDPIWVYQNGVLFNLSVIYKF